MTLQSEILDDPNYIPLLDHAFIGLVDHMGDDLSIVQAARVSYGSGTKSVREDRGLIRYLFRHQHTSPLEMGELKFHIKLPIFVMRQLVRHRTASLNEYSGRYSVMSDEFYIPDLENIQPQSLDNKQGRAGTLSEKAKKAAQWMIKNITTKAYNAYSVLLNESIYPSSSEDDPLFDEEFPGIARELARTLLPVGNYTECYWKTDLSNLFKLLKLRMDGHAQYEIRVFADAMYKLIQPIFPLACEAANDYSFQAKLFSRMDLNLLRDVVNLDQLKENIEKNGKKVVAERYEMSVRELDDFLKTFA